MILYLWMRLRGSICTGWLMPKGGLLITDNILQEGELVESRYVVTRRDRTIHTRIREYVYELTHNDNLITSIVPIGDGITLSVKK